MLASLSIRTKITVVIAFLLIAMTGMGLLAVVKMMDINANAEDIQGNWLPSVRAVGAVKSAANNTASSATGEQS